MNNGSFESSEAFDYLRRWKSRESLHFLLEEKNDIQDFLETSHFLGGGLQGGLGEKSLRLLVTK